MPRPHWLANPWAQNPWFETVAVAQRRAKKRLPASVYSALVAGSERGVSPSTTTPPPSPNSASPPTSSGRNPNAPCTPP